ncbi:HK97-gp10 family putative phage morphogenesis protein [Rhodobacter maris]|uniref:HK97 gp10 family phage protein n=1 Tax=Rhodobacter maris TaxID=446682 RepID=A0A285TI87_9RHOB|nr:HK97-gp10 family putative phage morphogenesis protein [Rhodobacter maris]SOC21970.1 HK97 gp10 family phage protein [Rhodobacter maris]
MANSTRLRIEGLADLERALDNLSKSVGRSVLRRSLRKAAEPMAERARALAPVKTGKLRESIKFGSLLNGSQRKLHRKLTLEERTAIELFLGPSYVKGSGGRVGHLVEFGTAPHGNGGLFAGTLHPGTPPRPFMRPAFDAEAGPTIARLKPILWAEIEKAAARAARKAARAAAKGR